jgi:hypothetical protein
VAAATAGTADAQVGAADGQQALDTAAQRQITRRLLQKATAASSMPSPHDPFMFGTPTDVPMARVLKHVVADEAVGVGDDQQTTTWWAR